MAKKNLTRFRVRPGSSVRLREWDPAWAGTDQLGKLRTDQLKRDAQRTIKRNLERLAGVQELLWASHKYALLVVLQGIDASGKDGLIKHVMSGLNPQGCQVFSFKQPSEEDLEHNFLWRYSKQLPSRGRIGIFNRSYYEEVLVVRVHPEWLERQKLPDEPGSKLWDERYEDINHFEEHLERNGTEILKFYLHISKEEQKRRLLKRLENPRKRWKFSPADLEERGYWDDYVKAYEDALSGTSTKRAPWYIIPADHKWVARSVVSEILAQKIQDLELTFPKLTKEQRIAIEKAKKLLVKE